MKYKKGDMIKRRYLGNSQSSFYVFVEKFGDEVASTFEALEA
jgi:hypothetical protein